MRRARAHMRVNRRCVSGFVQWSVLLWLSAAHILLAQSNYDVKAHYTKAEYMVPVRDGVRLYTQVYTPKDQSQNYPFLFFRTPYSVPPYGPENFRTVLGPTRSFDEEGFIFVFQDVRGKFRSEGEYILDRPIVERKTSKDIDETTDIYDTIEWLLRNIPNNNGRVGQWGISAPGIQTTFGVMSRHPALVASSPQASPGDQFIGDDFHHNGAFRLMYVFSWLSRNARIRTGPTETPVKPIDYGTPDGYRFFMDLGPVANVNMKYFHDQVPTWNEYMEHPNYDQYWEDRNYFRHLTNINHAVLNVAGWFDAEDFYGAMEVYYNIENRNPKNKSRLVVGPWSHGQWNRSDGDTLGHIRFGAKTSFYFRENVQLPFFNYYLKDKGELNLPEALVFETGTNQWKSYDQWPPKGVVMKNLYFHPDGKLSFDKPTDRSARAYDEYLSDPDRPVPFSSETRTTQGALWMIEDQRFAATRPDVLVYETDELSENITIAGDPLASLLVSMTGTDADFIVKLIDVYPGNSPDNNPNPQAVRMGHFQMLLAGEVMRGRFRNSFSKPEPFVPQRIAKVEFNLRDRYHAFLKGHRIMVQVQSTWFPVIDRNPQKFVDIYKAKESDFQKSTIRVYRSANSSSHVRLPVLQ